MMPLISIDRSGCAIYKKIDKTINTSEIEKEISSRVREELDYNLEHKHIRKIYFFRYLVKLIKLNFLKIFK